MAIKTQIYSIQSMRFINIILHLQLKRYRYLAIAIAVLLIALPIIKAQYIYASIILLFGTIPFIVFHLYFAALTRIKITPFAPQYLIISRDTITVVPTTGEEVTYPVAQIKYEGYYKENYILSTPDKGLLMVSANAFEKEEERVSFLKTVAPAKNN